jgi:hypothetical protein
MPEIFIYQIYHDGGETLDPGFRVLDNSSNERPDWFEYWPIRKFLLNETLAEDAFYGFLSPKFKQKTNLSAAAAIEFVRDESAADVILLSPSLHWTACYWNVFQYGDAIHPGLLEVATEFFQRIRAPTNLNHLVTHSRNEVYSNYMIAKPRFWRTWLHITEQLFALAESPDDPLGADLRKPTRYRGRRDVQMKIFIMERIATWILARDAGFVARARDPFVTHSRIYKLPVAIVCDSLKVAYDINGKEKYRELFRSVSRLAGLFNWQVRFGNLLGIRPVRSCLKALAKPWEKAGGS